MKYLVFVLGASMIGMGAYAAVFAQSEYGPPIGVLMGVAGVFLALMASYDL